MSWKKERTLSIASSAWGRLWSLFTGWSAHCPTTMRVRDKKEHVRDEKRERERERKTYLAMRIPRGRPCVSLGLEHETISPGAKTCRQNYTSIISSHVHAVQQEH